MSGKNSHFSVGECGELIFIKGIVEKVFDPLEKWGKWDCECRVFRPIFFSITPLFSLFSPIFPHSSPTLEVVPTFAILSCLRFPISPYFPPFPPIFLHFPPFSPFPSFFQTPKTLAQ